MLTLGHGKLNSFQERISLAQDFAWTNPDEVGLTLLTNKELQVLLDVISEANKISEITTSFPKLTEALGEFYNL